MKELIGNILLVFFGFFFGVYVAKRDAQRLLPERPLVTTNIVDNGLGDWLSDTNHTFGPSIAKKIFILQHPDGKFYIRYRESETNEFKALFVNDTAEDSADRARFAIRVNASLLVKKGVFDSLEDAFK